MGYNQANSEHHKKDVCAKDGGLLTPQRGAGNAQRTYQAHSSNS